MTADIVVPIDFTASSEVALEVTGRLARRMGAAVKLVSVASPEVDPRGHEHELATLAKGVDAPAVGAHVISSSSVAASLIGAVGPDGALCLETRAQGPLAAIVMGSVASEVIRASPQPVLLIGPETRPDLDFDLMEVCIDAPDAMAALLPVAAAWSRQAAMQVRLVHAWAAGESAFPTPAAAEEALEGAAAVLAQEYGVEAERAVLVASPASSAVLDDVEAHQASVVAVTVRPHTRLHPRVLGSMAIGVAHATRAVLLVVPAG